MFLIRDKSSGIVYDLREQNTALMLSQVQEQLVKLPKDPPNKAWKEWWEQKKERNGELLSASERGDVEVVQDLLDMRKHGDLAADPNSKGLDDFTPLHYAASEGHLEIVSMLLANGAKVNAQTLALKTPLHIACCRGKGAIIERLCEAGANLQAQDCEGNTPIHVLAECGFYELLKTLLQKRPDVAIKNSFGETPVELAATVNIRQLFATSIDAGTAGSPGYARTVLDGFILHNNRADMVKKLMFQTRFLPRAAPKLSSLSGSGSTDSKDPEGKGDSKVALGSRARIVRILEATTKIALSDGPKRKDSKAEDANIANNANNVKAAPKAVDSVGRKNSSNQANNQGEDAKEKEKASVPQKEQPKPDAGKEEDKDESPKTHAEDEVVTVDRTDFVTLQQLGKGSFGEVYLTEYKPTKKLYAMKVLAKRKVFSQNLLKYARAERNVLCYTKHPFIVGLDFAFQTTDSLFLLMDYCPG
jgi:ankyrin repeat protein